MLSLYQAKRKLIRALASLVCLAAISFPGMAQTAAEEQDAEATSDAEVSAQVSPERQAYRDQIGELVGAEPYSNKKTVTRWRLKNVSDKEKRREAFPEWIIRIFEWFESNDIKIKTISKVLEVLLWLVFAWAVAYVLYRYRGNIGRLLNISDQQQDFDSVPSSMFGLELSRDSLPQDVVGEAQALWAAGDSRKSVALLFRATLSRLLHDYSCRFTDSDTEQECCDEVARVVRLDQQEQTTPAGLTEFMNQLVLVWQQLAYRHRIPSDSVFKELCAKWQAVF